MPADVRQFVGEDRLELLGRQVVEDGQRDEDHRPKQADDQRRGDEQRGHQPDRPRELEPAAELAEHRRGGLTGGLGAQDLEALGGDPSPGVPEAHQPDAGDPQQHPVRQQRLDGVQQTLVPGEGDRHRRHERRRDQRQVDLRKIDMGLHRQRRLNHYGNRLRPAGPVHRCPRR